MGEELTYHDLFQDKFIFESVGKGEYYEETYPNLVKERNRKPTRYIKYLLNFGQMLRWRPNRNGNLLFLEHKFEQIARYLSDDYNIYLLHDSINIYNEFKKEKYFQFFYRNWLKLVDKSFISHDMSYAAKAINDVQKYLRRNNIDIVFAGNDKMFIEKLLLKAAQNINIPTVVIQHGIYTDEISFEKLQTADTAENFWVWSQYVKDCYLKRYNKDQNHVKVIGYPFELLDEKPKGKKSVLFLGNNYRKSDYGEGMKFLERVKTVLEVCNELRIPFYYRPHPGEIIDDEYQDILSHVKKGTSLLEDIDMARIVIGDVSSAMVEAALCGRNVIQIIWNELSKIASTDPMYDFTIKISDDKNEIKQAIIQSLDSNIGNPIDEYYMYKNTAIFKDIHSYIEELIKR